jgi:hypothetical protein
MPTLHRLRSLRARICPAAALAPPSEEEPTTSPWHEVDLFDRSTFPGLTQDQRSSMDLDGHVVLPGILTDETQARLIESLGRIVELDATHQLARASRKLALERARDSPGATPEAKAAAKRALNSWGEDGGLGMRLSVGACVAEHDEYLESVVGHPQMLALAKGILGENIRFDHCCSSSGRVGGDQGMGYHSHSYADERKTWAEAEVLPDDPGCGFIRIFFYINGFELNNGNLKTVPGSHLFRRDLAHGRDDESLEKEWIKDKTHPVTGEPLQIRRLSCPPGSVVAMWTHAAHGVDPKPAGSPRRWALITAYRNPGQPSVSRWMTPKFTQKPTPGLKMLEKDHVYPGYEWVPEYRRP